MKRATLIAITILFLALCACGSSNDATTANKSTTAAPTTNTSATATMSSLQTKTTAPPLHFAIKDTVDVGGIWEIHILSVKKSAGSEYIAPKAGNTFLLIDITMKNISSTEQESFGPAMFKLRDSSGQEIIITFVPGTPQAPIGKVEAGMQIRGTLAYEVVNSEHNLMLAFEANSLASGQAIWDIKV